MNPNMGLFIDQAQIRIVTFGIENKKIVRSTKLSHGYVFVSITGNVDYYCSVR